MNIILVFICYGYLIQESCKGNIFIFTIVPFFRIYLNIYIYIFDFQKKKLINFDLKIF